MRHALEPDHLAAVSTLITGGEPRVSRRVRALLGLVLVALAQWTSLAHVAAERHIICPEHGELLDIGTSGPATSSRAESVFERPGAGRRAGHDVCPFSAFLNGLAVPVHAAVSPAPHAAAERAILPTVANAALRLAVHRYAPKTSPPQPSLHRT
jgi:hypothetical protein